MIDVKGLSYRYGAKERLAVQDVSFSIPQGEIFGFLGPSGAGKSTAQKILIGLLQGYTGSVQVFGKSLAEQGSAYYEHIGVSFELPNHYRKLTALENLNFFRSLYSVPTRDPIKLLQSVGLVDDAKKQVGDYSKGMQMRLNFIRSLLNRPKLLFLDEPTSGMDPTNARIIKDMIRAEKEQGTTIFLTTHNMAVADELCDRVAFLVDGKIRLVGSPRELKIQHGKKTVRLGYKERNEPMFADFPLSDLAHNAAFLSALRIHQVETIHTLEATLEDIFIQCTGVKLA